MILIDYKWYWSYDDSISLCVLEFDNIMNTFVSYIWVWNSWNEKIDINIISKYWNKISKEVALAIFWNKSYQWYDIKNNYKTN